MTTRRQAVAGAAAGLLALRAPAALAAGGSDEGPLSALVAYAQQVVFGYEVVLAKAPLAPADRPALTRFRAQAQQAAAALRTALEQAGGKPAPAPDPATAPPAADASRRGYLRELIAAEEASVASYYTMLQEMTGERHLAGTAAFMAAGGRRLVVLRQMAHEPLLPRAFETGAA